MPSEPHATERAFRLPWSPRTIVILVPLHLIAFALLYLAVFQLTVHEVVRTYKAGSGAFLAEAANSLHSAMLCSQDDNRRQRLQTLMESRKVLGLEIFTSTGQPLSPGTAADPSVTAFLASTRNDEVVTRRVGRSTLLVAMTKIRTTPRCEPCHVRNTVAGALVVNRDLTASLKATRRRTAVGLAFLVGGWLGLVGVVNLASRRFAQASVDRLKARVGTEPPSASPTTATLGMDSLSHELYRTLEATLRQHHEERTTLESRFENAERLACMGQLTAGLAHEIKNPLAGVQGALEILVEECRNDERIDLYRRMLEELRRVNETLHSLLHFARPRKPRRMITDIRELLEDIAGLARPGLSRRNISLTIRVDHQARTFTLDPGQIRQAVVNLITNAADAIGESGSIELLATPFPEGEGLILAVVDDGHGMDEETQREMFEPFFTTKLHGTGLGLAVVRKIVEEHGGSIEITSKSGQGTTVFLIFPEPDHAPSSGGGLEA